MYFDGSVGFASHASPNPTIFRISALSTLPHTTYQSMVRSGTRKPGSAATFTNVNWKPSLCAYV